MKFQAHPAGLPGLLAGKVTLAEFTSFMQSWHDERAVRWTSPAFAAKWEKWRAAQWPLPDGGVKVTRERLDAALDHFAAQFPFDPLAASRAFVSGLLDPVARDLGKRHWVETTPSNGLYASTLFSIFPDLKLVHIVRDGRDVASSRLARPRRRRDPHSGTQEAYENELHLWARRLRAMDAESRRLPPDRSLLVYFERLVALEREETYSQLREFLSLEDEEGLRTFFDSRVTVDRAHLGRWRESDHLDRARVDEIYGALLSGLRAEGVACVPDPDLLGVE